jgi:hypothetical protein
VVVWQTSNSEKYNEAASKHLRPTNHICTERKSKRVIYRIADNFYRFWFRYIYPNKSFLELGETGYVMDEIKNTFNAFAGLAFEDIAAEFLRDKFRVGKWWYKDTEIDLVGLREGEVAFFEVKWRDMSYRDAGKVLRKLEEKAEAVKIKGERSYGLIARRIEGKAQLGGYVYDLRDFSKSRKKKPFNIALTLETTFSIFL